MATGNFILDKGYAPAVALTKFRAVKFSAEETVTPVTAKTDVVAGVVQFDVATGEITKGKLASVRVEGASEMEASGTCTVGALCGLTANGTVHDAVTGDRVIGTFRQGAASGAFASVQLGLPGNII
ncbi:MAG TPA: hypothetical protein VGE97_09290 [Nitrososphaera sp.]|jgi:hypothetical protein